MTDTSATAPALPAQAHAGADPLRPPLTDWALVPFEASRLPPLLVGALIVVVFTAICQVFRAATEDVGLAFWSHRYFWVDVLNGVLFAYPATATALVRRGRLRDLRDLRPVFSGSDTDFAAVVREVVCVPPLRLAATGFVFAVLLGLMPVFDAAYWESGRPAFSDPVMIFHLLRMGGTGWLMGHAFASEATGAVGLHRLGARWTRVDLLDLAPLAPFARSAQRSAFAWVLAASLVSLFWLGPAVGSSNGAIIGAILLLVTLVFAFSIHGAHLRIRATKREALGALDDQIRRGGAVLMQGRTAEGAPPMADLVALHGFLGRVREWPIGAPAILRGALIAGLALGSWLGGALVERLLEQFVG